LTIFCSLGFRVHLGDIMDLDINLLLSLITLISAIGGAGYWIGQVEKKIEDKWESELAQFQQQVRGRHENLLNEIEKLNNKLENHITRYEGEQQILKIRLDGLAGKVKSKHQDVIASINDIVSYLMTAPPDRPFVKRPRMDDTIGDDWTLGG